MSDSVKELILKSDDKFAASVAVLRVVQERMKAYVEAQYAVSEIDSLLSEIESERQIDKKEDGAGLIGHSIPECEGT